MLIILDTNTYINANLQKCNYDNLRKTKFVEEVKNIVCTLIGQI